MKRHRARALPLLGAALLLSALTACDGILGGGDDVLGNQLRLNEQKWQQAGPPQTYRLDLLVARGADTTSATVRIQVQNGAVQSATYVDGGDPVPANLLANYPPVEGLFAIVRDALGRRVSGMAISYDTEYGFPEEIAIDYDYRRLDDNLYVRAHTFVRE